MTLTSTGRRARLPHQDPPRRARDVVAGLAAGVALLALLGGVPLLLVLFVGWPLPTTVPSSDWLTAPLDGGTLLKVIATLVWLAWAHFLVCVVVEWRQERRGTGMPVRVPLGGGSQALARRLVAAVLVLLSGAVVVAPANAATLPDRRPAAVQASAEVLQQGADGVRRGATAAAQAGGDLSGRSADASRLSGSPVDAYSAAAAAARHARAVTGTGRADALKLYEVRPPEGRHHDTLWDIAVRHLGDGLRYKELVALNRGRAQPDGRALRDPDLIHPGWVLVMPADASGPGITVVDPVLGGGATGGSGGAVPDPRPPSDGATSDAGTDGAQGAGGGSGDVRQGAAGASTADRDGAAGPSVALTGLGVAGAALAAGLLVALRRRRGPFGGAGDGDDEEAEAALRLAADEPTARRVDVALRDLGLRLSEAGRELPVVYAGWLDAGGSLTLALSPGVVDPPAPWTADPSGRTWTLDAATPVGLRPGDAGAAAPYPGLVSIGRRPSDGALTLLDLEAAPGIVSLGGHLETARHVAASVAVELGTNLWSDGLQVTLVGFGDDLTALAPDRLRRVDDLDQVLDDVEGRTAVQASACTQTGLASVLRGRQVRPGPVWSPQFLVLSAPPTPEQVRRLALLADDRRRAVGVLVVGDVPAARWRAVLDADGVLRAPVLGLEVQAQVLPPSAYGPLVRVFRTGAASARGDALDRALSGLAPGATRGPDDDPGAAGPLAAVLAPEQLDPTVRAPVEVRVLGPVEVQAPPPPDGGPVPARPELARELVVAVALHPGGLHPRVLSSYLWPRGAGEDVQAATIAEVQQWLGQGPDGRPRLHRDGEGRWRLGGGARVDLHVAAALVSRSRSAGADEAADLAAALAFVRGEAWTGLPAGRYAWLARNPAEQLSRRLVVAAAARLADLALDQDDHDLAEEALRTGLTMVPVAEELWRALLRLHHGRGGPNGAAGVAEEMYATLATHDVPGGAAPETDALVEALAPGYRRRTA